MIGLHLLPSSGYRLFSDGYHLLWHLGDGMPKMWRSPDGEIDLDALAFWTGFWVREVRGEAFLVGTPGIPVTALQLLTAIEAHLVSPSPQYGISRANVFKMSRTFCIEQYWLLRRPFRHMFRTVSSPLQFVKSRRSPTL